MSYLSIVLVSCLATLSLASPVARQSDKLPYTIVPCDVAGNFTMLALRNETSLELVTPLALGLNGLAGAEYSLAVFTLFFFFPRLLRRVNEPCNTMNRRLPGLSIQVT